MSFDVFFQRFTDGDAGEGGNSDAIRVLDPYLVRDLSSQLTHLRTADGTAQLFGLNDQDGFMANHIEGDTPWKLLVDAARAADFAIMPVGCPVFVLSPQLVDHLPPELVADAGVQVITTVEELLAAIRA